jgi:hypothetical protein
MGRRKRKRSAAVNKRTLKRTMSGVVYGAECVAHFRKKKSEGGRRTASEKCPR